VHSAAANTAGTYTLHRPAERAPARVPALVAWGFACAIVLTYCGTIGRLPLAEPDEPRYAEIPREMIELGDWVTPRLNYVKYFEKPPLLYWLTAINFQLFGTSEFVARLWPAACGVAGIGMAFLLGRSMYGPWVGAVAAAVLAATPFHFALSQYLILDMPLSTLMTVALGGFWFAYHDGRRQRALVLLLYGCTALAVLAKGPVAAVLTGGVIIVFLLWQRDLGALRWVVSPLGVCLFLAVALPWFVLVSQRNPEFVHYFIVEQHLDRYLRPSEHRESVFFFVPIVLAGMLPWTAFLLLAPRAARALLLRLVRGPVSAATRFCLVWSAVIFIFFSVSGSKLGTYILPMFCPLAILAARFFHQLVTDGGAYVLRRGYVAALVLGAGTILGGAVTGEVTDDWRAAIIVPLLYTGGVALGTAAVAALLLVRRRALPASLAAMALGMLVVQVVASGGRGVAPNYQPLAMAIRERAAADDLIVVYRHYVQGITFYSQRRVVAARGHGELDFGSRQGDQRAFFWKTDQELADAWASGRHMFLVANRSELETLRPRLRPPPREIAGHSKKVVVANFSSQSTVGYQLAE
jgi:4-amino-4-deoxy-L-arabinose transferase-like glycosyltransferase